MSRSDMYLRFPAEPEALRTQVAIFVQDRYRITSMSLRSPLEMVLAASSVIALGTTTVTVAGHRILRLFDRYQQSRQEAARADAVVQAYRVITSELAAEDDDRTEQFYIDNGALPVELPRASRALAHIEQIQLLGRRPRQLRRP